MRVQRTTIIVTSTATFLMALRVVFRVNKNEKTCLMSVAKSAWKVKPMQTKPKIDVISDVWEVPRGNISVRKTDLKALITLAKQMPVLSRSPTAAPSGWRIKHCLTKKSYWSIKYFYFILRKRKLDFVFGGGDDPYKNDQPESATTENLSSYCVTGSSGAFHSVSAWRWFPLFYRLWVHLQILLNLVCQPVGCRLPRHTESRMNSWRPQQRELFDRPQGFSSQSARSFILLWTEPKAEQAKAAWHVQLSEDSSVHIILFTQGKQGFHLTPQRTDWDLHCANFPSESLCVTLLGNGFSFFTGDLGVPDKLVWFSGKQISSEAPEMQAETLLIFKTLSRHSRKTSAGTDKSIRTIW